MMRRKKRERKPEEMLALLLKMEEAFARAPTRFSIKHGDSVCEKIAWDRPLSESERQTMEAWADKKFGVPLDGVPIEYVWDIGIDTSYDESGNGRHAVQHDPARQPRRLL
jgi:hypothetical protein